MQKKLNGFSMIELLTAVLVTAILSMAFVFIPSMTRQSAKSEAEKIAAKIKNLMQQADRRHIGFTIEFYENINEVRIKWSDDHHQVLPVNSAFRIKSNNNGANLVYSIKNSSFLPPGRTITVKRDDGKEYYVIIYVPGGRIRTSAQKPAD